MLTQDTPDSLTGLKEALDRLNLRSKREMENLLWEYTRLFIGPYKLPCPPWESVYTSPKRLMMQEAYEAVQDFYEDAGLALDNPGIMADHIGAELNFLAVLYEKIMDQPEKKTYYMDRAKRFGEEHLKKWVPQFTSDMEQAADSNFYKALARITRDVILTANNSEP